MPAAEKGPATASLLSTCAEQNYKLLAPGEGILPADV